MAGFLKRSWAEVDLDSLEHNVRQVQSRLRGGAMLMGVVKADAYGHGAEQVARRLATCGANWFGVSNMEEGEALRRSGIRKPILIFGTTPPELAGRIFSGDMTQTVYALEYAQALHESARAQNVVVNCHIKMDTGMTRLGFVCDESGFAASIDEMEQACALSNLHIDGAFTHFAVADENSIEAIAYTKCQFERFLRATEALRARGITIKLRHCANSAGAVCYPEFQLEMVRAGIILYGLQPSAQCADKLDLCPVMQLKTVVASVKQVDAGTKVSYGGIYTAPKKITTAVVPIGYADGYQRGLSNKARMLINGHFAPVIGRVCMDQVMLDVTGIPDVKRGDTVTVFGQDSGAFLPVDELAEILGSINYEFTCLLSKRIPRIYLHE